MDPGHFDQNLVRKAMGGCEQSLSQLSQLAEQRVRAYIFGVTLDQDLTGDLVQESLLQMIRSLQQLRDTTRFWPWMYRIAQSKIQQHYTDRRRLSQERYKVPYTPEEERADSGLHFLERKERTQKVLDAIARLKQKERAALVLRCFEKLSYAEIAQALVCNEIGARVQVYRAKQSLKRQLLRQGLSHSTLFTSLCIFGAVAARGKAATLTQISLEAQTAPTITSAVLKTDFATSCVSLIASKLSHIKESSARGAPRSSTIAGD